ncbi:MAG: hypothetical protein ACKO5Q_02075 [Microcystaceae cyanobacterium]
MAVYIENNRQSWLIDTPARLNPMTQLEPNSLNDTIPKIEVEIDPDMPGENTLGDRWRLAMQQFFQWYERQNAPVKIALAVTGISIALSLTLKVLHLIASIISVTILAVILYGLYQVFVKPKSQV